MKIEEYLKNVPPGKFEQVECELNEISGLYKSYKLLLPDMLLYCHECKGERIFKPKVSKELYVGSDNNLYIYFTCKNCEKDNKIYSTSFIMNNPDEIMAYKFGELPHFAPPTPSKLFSLIGEDKEYFLIGRRAENQGMGIGAFAYYRRVVENQKNRIIDELIKVMKKVNVDETTIESFETAKKETQFTKSIETIKDILPNILFIDGHNPLTLLHSALSKGLHSEDEAECLELATSIRIVLSELSSRTVHVLSEKKNLKEAVSILLKKKKNS